MTCALVAGVCPLSSNLGFVVRVFLSSTQTDLEAEREVAYYAINYAGHQVVRMEDFGSNTLASWNLCVKKLDSCEAYVLLIGTTYGSPLLDTGLSYTHAEYERAHIKGLPILAYIKDGQPDENDSEDSRRLREFVEVVNNEHQVRDRTSVSKNSGRRSSKVL